MGNSDSGTLYPVQDNLYRLLCQAVQGASSLLQQMTVHVGADL